MTGDASRFEKTVLATFYVAALIVIASMPAIVVSLWRIADALSVLAGL